MTIFQKYRAESYSVSFEAWAYGVLRMKVGNYLQRYPVKHKQLYLNLDAGGIHEHSVDPPDHEFKAKLIDCVRKIAKAHQRYARVVNLSYHGFSPKEICLRLKITSGNMRVILSRGRSILKDCLETGRI